MNAKMMFGVVIAAVALSAGMGTAGADDGNGLKVGRAKPSAPLVGAWQVRVTPYNCVTGVPVPPLLPYTRGVQTADQGIEMPDNDHFSGDAKVTFRDVNGNVVAPPVPPPGQPVPQGCARFAGTRME